VTPLAESTILRSNLTRDFSERLRKADVPGRLSQSARDPYWTFNESANCG
jgi:hypothetical protein